MIRNPHFIQVDSRAKGRARAGQDDGAYRTFLMQVDKRLFEILHVLERLEEQGIHKGLESQILDEESYCSN